MGEDSQHPIISCIAFLVGLIATITLNACHMANVGSRSVEPALTAEIRH